jgi:predicted CopG family antitoxin
MVNIEISDFVKESLDAIKQSEGHKSLDSVVRVLLEAQRSQTLRRAATKRPQSAKEPENEIARKSKAISHGGGIGGERR